MLHNFVQIYVPGTKEKSVPIDRDVHDFWVRKVAATLAAKFGGATVTPAEGYWISDTKGLIVESVVIVTSYFDGAHNGTAREALTLARTLAGELKEALQQESVTIGTNDGIDFV